MNCLFSEDYFKSLVVNEDTGLPVSIKSVICVFPALAKRKRRGQTSRSELPENTKALLTSQRTLIFITEQELIQDD